MTSLRVVHDQPTMDLVAAEEAAARLLTALGLALDNPDMTQTPRRLAGALAEMLTVPQFDATTFENTEGYDDLVLVQDISFQSLCEHHMLPFVGVAHVGYLPAARILGLSKFARTVDHFARRPQTQERLTMQIARHLSESLTPNGVGVVLEAEHTCMSLRGARATGARTVTSSLLGHIRDNPATRSEFLALARGDRR